MKNGVLKKLISSMISLAMLFSCLVFSVPANAATSTVYKYRIKVSVDNDFDNSTDSKSYYIIKGKPTNGTGSESEIVNTQLTSNISTGNGDKYLPSDAGSTSSSFPTYMEIHLYKTSGLSWGVKTKGSYTAYLQLYNYSTNSWNDVANTGNKSGSGHLDINGSCSVGDGDYPYAPDGTSLSRSGNITLDGTNSKSVTISKPTTYDQWGVQMNASLLSISKVSATYNNSYITLSGTTLTATKNAHISNSGVNSQNVTINGMWNGAKRDVSTNSLTISITDEQYSVNFNDYNGTSLKTQKVYYGDGATAPSNLTRPYDTTNHYSFSGWNKAFSIILSDTIVTALYTATAHSYTDSVTTQPTCTQTGVTKHTCSCGYSYTTNEPDALGHDYQTAVTAPTCTEQGYTTYTCSRCNDSYVSDYTDALNHEYTLETINPTCTEDGLKTYTCIRKDHSYTEVIPATGHKFSSEPKKYLSETSHQPYACFECENCALQTDCKVITEESTGETKWVSTEDGAYADVQGTVISKDSLSIPTADIECGGAGVRVPGVYSTGEDITSGIRFSCTMDIPEGATIIDFGMMYTLVPYVVKDTETPSNHVSDVFGTANGTNSDSIDLSKLTFDYTKANNITTAGVSYSRSAQYANFSVLHSYKVYSGTQGSGTNIGSDSTAIASDSAKSISFNLVISGLADNITTAKLSKIAYSRVARGYLTYTYLGEEFTIYDSVLSARNMHYIATKVLENPNETVAAKKYCQSIIDRCTELGFNKSY